MLSFGYHNNESESRYSQIPNVVKICNKLLNFSRTRQHPWLYKALVVVTLLLTLEVFVFKLTLTQKCEIRTGKMLINVLAKIFLRSWKGVLLLSRV